MSRLDTRSALLSEAEALIRTMGYAAFSYADRSERVGIRKASIHHHFPTKESLGTALVDSYLERFVRELDELAARPIDARAKRLAYCDFFAGSLRDGRMPLCGALAADAAFLPASMQRRVKKLFELHLAWLEGIIRDGAGKHELKTAASAQRTAMLLLSTLQGASIVAWALKDHSAIKPTFKQVLDSIAP
jgi:TetR/AcrR family transcriptional repressor of nem operon